MLGDSMEQHPAKVMLCCSFTNESIEANKARRNFAANMKNVNRTPVRIPELSHLVNSV